MVVFVYINETQCAAFIYRQAFVLIRVNISKMLLKQIALHIFRPVVEIGFPLC